MRDVLIPTVEESLYCVCMYGSFFSFVCFSPSPLNLTSVPLNLTSVNLSVNIFSSYC